MRTVSLLFVLLFTGCNGPGSWSEEERDAVEACVNAALDAFPYVRPDSLRDGPKMADLDQSVLHSLDGGKFEFEFPAVGKEFDFAFRCEGSLTERQITKVFSGKPGFNSDVSVNRSF